MNRRNAIICLKEAQLKIGHARATRKTYRGWLDRYIDGASKGHYVDLQGFLDDLSTRQGLDPKTVRQALNAMVFFYKSVLKQEPGKLNVPKINRNRNQPTWLHHTEVIDLLNQMTGVPKLQAALLYGTGSRINALLTLRLKDIDLHAGLVTFRFDKGGKSRTVRLPQSLIPALTDHVEGVKARWKRDNAAGVIAPTDNQSLMRKLGRNTFSKLPWYWLFPSQVTRGQERWHTTDSGLSKAIAIAAKKSGSTKRITPHTLRHSHATALSDNGVPIRNIQKQMGHSHIETTEIYLHTTATGGPISPLDHPQVVPFQPRQPLIIEPASFQQA